MSHRQGRVLAEAAGPDGRPAVYVLACCGLRCREMAALKGRDVDLSRHRITVAAAVTEVQGHLMWGSPKTNQRRTVPIPAFIAPANSEEPL